MGDREIISSLGELLRELGGVRRDPPRRTWQVGQILTKREISSLGTLMTWSVAVGQTLHLHIYIRIDVTGSDLRTMNRSAGPEQMSCLGHHAGTADGPW